MNPPFRFPLQLALVACIGIFPTATAREGSEESRVEEAIERRKSEVRAQIEKVGLTNDWWGFGPKLTEHGIRFEAAATFFAQRPLTGGDDTSPHPGGKLDGLLRLDLHRLGLWKGLSLTAHPEYNFGETSNGLGGTVLPINVALQLPGTTPGQRYDTSSLFLTQRFNETFSVILGKTNLADVAALHPYAGGAGLTGFMNGGLAAAPNGAVPPYVYGGLLLARTRKAIFSLGVYGGSSAQGSLSFNEAFDQGYLLSTGVAVPVIPGGLPGKQSLSILWGDRDATALANLGNLIPPGNIGTLAEFDTRRWVVTYSFHQALAKWSDTNGWGIWGRANLSDGDLTAVAWSVAGGIGGDSPLKTREADRWGLGLFYFSFADFLKDPTITSLPLGDEYGLELFYNATLASWFRLTGDLQIIQPGVPDRDPVVMLGLRASVRF